MAEYLLLEYDTSPGRTPETNSNGLANYHIVTIGLHALLGHSRTHCCREAARAGSWSSKTAAGAGSGASGPGR